MENQYKITFVYKGKPTAYNDLSLSKAIKVAERFEKSMHQYRAWRFNTWIDDFELVTLEDLEFISNSK